MKIIIRIFLLLFLTFTQKQFAQGVNPNFDFSGIEEFWHIVNIFEKNQEPSNNDWSLLFNTPGYKVLTGSEFPQKFFKDSFRLVFKPSESKNLELSLKQKRNLHHLKHYIKVRDNKNKVNAQLKKLKREQYNRTAVRRTLEFLPQNSVSQYPPVSFVIFESNGRGSSPIVVDLAASIEWDFVSFLAHEFHHWYRNRQLKFDYRKIKTDDLEIISVLSHVEAEGIADMVDKKDWFTKSNNAISIYARRFISDVGKTPFVIQQMDKILKQISEESGDKRKLGRKLRSLLPQKGHTTGYFMASLILETLGKKVLVNTVGNPFDFFLLYNKAAKIKGRYPYFSKASVNFIKSLKYQYNNL